MVTHRRNALHLTSLAGCLVAFLTLTACDKENQSRSLPPGCYYGKDGAAFFKVEGRRARFLIPGNMREVELIWVSNDLEHFVQARPGFYLAGPNQIEKNRSMAEIRLPIIESGDGPTIGLPYSPEGDYPVTLGKPC